RQQIAEELRALLRLSVARAGQVQVESDQPVGIKPRLDPENAYQAAEEQARADQEQQSQSHFENHQRAAEPGVVRALAGAAAAFAERSGEAEPCGVDGWDEPEDGRSGQRSCEREQKSAPVHGRLREPRNLKRLKR